MIPVILSGGSGTRLWPLSRKSFPKQFQKLVGENTMLQETLKRVPEQCSAPIVVCHKDHQFIVADQLTQMGKQAAVTILEPFGRNTAPAITMAALHLKFSNKNNQACNDETMLVLPADHHIKDIAGFHAALDSAKALVDEGKLVTFGITPTCAETGYGYIKLGQQIGDDGYSVDEFLEKPNASTAENYVESGNYVWNSGMFMMNATVFLQQMKSLNPHMLKICMNAYNEMHIEKSVGLLSDKIFSLCPDDSIDYAVMEKTDLAACVPLSVGWSDVGQWSSLHDVQEKDENGNVFKGDVLTKDVKNTFVMGGEKLIALLGVENLVVSETKDALFIADRSRSQDVKELVGTLDDAERPESKIHREVDRPWGSYDSIDNGERFQVKHIKVKPGGKLSLQQHHHRSEHWIIVKGTALVTLGEKQFMLSENESTYIPIGEIHRLENPGKVPVELIEVQTGCYLGEDDIIRFEDTYGRVKPNVIPMSEGKNSKTKTAETA